MNRFDNLRRVLTFIPPDAKLEDYNRLTNINLPTHPLVGKKLKNQKNGKIYLVEKVNLQFYHGWFYGALMQCDGSHTFLYFQNKSCDCDTVLDSIEKFWYDFKLEE